VRGILDDVIRVSHPPTKPRPFEVLRYPILGSFAVGFGLMAWKGLAQALAGTKAAIPSPDAGHVRLAILGVVLACIGATVAAVLRHYHWTVAMETQKVYESVARVLRLPLDERARMKVRARDGRVPADVRVRVDSVTSARDERVRKNLGRAFADATGEPVERVRVETIKRGVRIWVERPQEAHEPADYDSPDSPDAEPKVAPVPARPTDDRTQERVTAAMRGALNDKGVQVTVTDTLDNGAPQEVWVEYPPALTASILGALQTVRDTMERVHHARNDEWTVRWVSAHDRIVLTDRVDPLARIVQLPEVHARADLHKGVQVGITESGSPWLIPLMGGNHTLVAGASGSGKGSVLWNVLRGVAPLVKDGRARLWLIAPKGGMELGPAEHAAYRFAVTPEDAEKMLAELRVLMQAKAERLRREGRRKIEEPTTDEPLDLVVVDELANATSLGGNAGRAVGDHIAALCSMGRAPAVTVIGAVQDPRKETFKHRGLFTHAVALRMSEANETNLILGQGARAQGAIADLIPKAHPGIGYVIRDGQAGHERVRAAYVSDEEIEATVRRMERPLDPPPIGEPIARARQDELAAQPVRIIALNDFPVRAHFDGDEDPVTITGWENSDEEDRIIVSFHYDGGAERTTDVEDSETVRLAP
jgi:DNA segregation ATPase FtsK/SpoIIIE-like protein